LSSGFPLGIGNGFGGITGFATGFGAGTGFSFSTIGSAFSAAGFGATFGGGDFTKRAKYRILNFSHTIQIR
jgi:hypothetical protein